MIDSVQRVVSPMRNSDFHTTSWTLILTAAGASTSRSRDALASLCQTYWHPVYAFIRRNGYDRDQAQDLTQGFFALLLEKNYLLDANRERGKFRSFLLTAVKNFLANEWDRAHALKRGGNKIPISIDIVEAELWSSSSAMEKETPENLFERRWALSLLEQVASRLRAEHVAAGKTKHLEALFRFINGDADGVPYDVVAVQLGLSVGGARTAVHRMRRRYRDLLRAEIADTVSHPDEIDDEIRFLLSTLSTP
jgi:DNA-directed RNA polymerase specialized sigma24 family protein